MVKSRSLYLTRPWIGTGSWRTDRRRRTDRIAIANTRLAVLAVQGRSDGGISVYIGLPPKSVYLKIFLKVLSPW